MRTTISLDDELLRRAKREAAERGTTLSGVIADALRGALDRAHHDQRVEPFAMVTFYGEGGSRPAVDLNDNSTLADTLDEDGGWTSSM